jgi:hypothetical protein
VGGHQYPPGRCVGIHIAPESEKSQLQIITEERDELKLSRGANWSRWVATNVHLDQT